MTTPLLFTRLLNHLFARQANWLLGVLHVTPVSYRAPITNAVAMEFLVFVVLLAYFVVVRLSLSVEKPNGLQNLAELLNEGVQEQSEAIIGHGFERFTSFLTALFLFILLCNLVGLIPGLESPTANPSVPLGFAVVTFLYYHYHGIRVNKGAYIKQFLGPVWWLYWLLFPIEIISHFARVLSLTVRLYANMFAGDLLTLAFFSLVPIGIPLVFLGLHLGVAVVQAYVFAVLAAIYLGLAVAHEH
jgi:F-type H+-transporting ATPase subunit a